MDLKFPRRPASAEGPGLLSLAAFSAPLAQRKRRPPIAPEQRRLLAARWSGKKSKSVGAPGGGEGGKSAWPEEWRTPLYSDPPAFLAGTAKGLFLGGKPPTSPQDGSTASTGNPHSHETCESSQETRVFALDINFRIYPNVISAIHPFLSKSSSPFQEKGAWRLTGGSSLALCSDNQVKGRSWLVLTAPIFPGLEKPVSLRSGCAG